MEEMLALDKNQTWRIVDLLREKGFLCVNGCLLLNIERMIK